MPDENDSERSAELQTGQTSGASSNLAGAPDLDGPRPWGRAQRTRMLTWVAIGFILPGLLIFALHLQGNRSDAVFSIRSELPVKAVLACFMALATWVVSA